MKTEKGAIAKKIIEEFKKDGYYFDNLEPFLSVVSYKKGEYIYEPFQKSSRLLFLRQGTVKLSLFQSDGVETLADYYHAPIVLGELELLKVREESHPIQAATDCILIQIPIKQCDEIIRGNNVFMENLCRECANKTVITMKKLIRLQTCNLNERLAAWFVDNCDKDGNVFYIPLAEMSNYFGVTYRHLSRVLNSFVEKGALVNNRGHLQVTDFNYFKKLKEQRNIE